MLWSRRALWRGLHEVALLAALPTLLSLGARWWWPLDLCTSFHPQYAVLLAVCAAVFLIARRWICGAIMAALAVYNLALVLPVYFGPSIPPPRGATVRLMQANLNTTINHDHAAFLQVVADADPDLLVVIEFDTPWRRALEPLRARYPRSLLSPREDNFGLALFSRLPVADLQVIQLGDVDVPVIAASGVADRFDFIAIHAVVPTSAANARGRARQFRQLAERVRAASCPVVVMGDLNVAPWSPHFTDLLRQGGLRDSRAGFGLQPSWMVVFPLLAAPIDHLLTTPGLRVHDRHIGPGIGSDHRPVIVVLELADV